MGETLINGTSGLDIWVEKQLVEEKLRDVRAEETTEKAVTAAMKDFGIQRSAAVLLRCTPLCRLCTI